MARTRSGTTRQLEALARLRWVEALDVLDESRLDRHANREVLQEVLGYLKRSLIGASNRGSENDGMPFPAVSGGVSFRR